MRSKREARGKRAGNDWKESRAVTDADHVQSPLLCILILAPKMTMNVGIVANDPTACQWVT